MFAVIIALIIGLAVHIFAIVLVAVLICHYRNKEKEKSAPPPEALAADDVTSPYGNAWYADWRNEPKMVIESHNLN